MNRKEKLKRLSWFKPNNRNDTLAKDGFVYFKHWDGNREEWTVSKFTHQSWANMKNVRGKSKENEMKKANEELERKYFID